MTWVKKLCPPANNWKKSTCSNFSTGDKCSTVLQSLHAKTFVGRALSENSQTYSPFPCITLLTFVDKENPDNHTREMQWMDCVGYNKIIPNILWQKHECMRGIRLERIASRAFSNFCKTIRVIWHSKKKKLNWSFKLEKSGWPCSTSDTPLLQLNNLMGWFVMVKWDLTSVICFCLYKRYSICICIHPSQWHKTQHIVKSSRRVERYYNLFHSTTNYFSNLGKGQATKSDVFSEKYQRRGVIFNPKNYIADFGNFKRFGSGFLP